MRRLGFRRRDRVLASLGIAALVTAVLMVPPDVPAAAGEIALPGEFDDPFDEPEGTSPESDESDSLGAAEAAAIFQAARSGERVEVESARSEWDSLFAEPSGELTLETSAAAIRTRVGVPKGDWREIDLSLEVTSDGTVAPVAPGLPLEFSGGGRGPLAKIGRDGHELALSWPTALPEPLINESQIRYIDVLPGVDLVVSPHPDGTGFTEVLVVKTPEAAANPALATLSLGLEVSGGLEIEAGPNEGGFVVVDRLGEPVFTSPPAVMWDSSGGAASDQLVDGAGLSADGGGLDPAVERTRSPRSGDRVVEVATEVGDGSISLVPDEGLLTDPDTVWPVFIDPSISGSRNVWTMLQSAWPSQASYKFSGDEGLGRCEVAFASACNKNNTKRLAWGFSGLSAVRGSAVSSATFSAYGTHSYSCDTKSVRVYRINSIKSSTTWSSMSGWGDSRLLQSRSLAHKPACSNDRWVEWNVKDAAQWAANNSNSLYLGLRATSETSMPGGWKRYRHDARLSITFNHQPNKPTGLRTTSPAMSKCAQSSDRPWVNDNTPVLRATITDPNGDNVRGRFSWSKLGSGGTWGAWTYANTAYGASGSERSYQLPTLSDGRYRWRVRGYDGSDYGPYSTGPNSSYCYFEVKQSAPPAPTVEIASPYEFDWWQTPDGLPQGTLTIGRAGDSSVITTRYRIGDGPQQSTPISSASTTVSFTPTYGVTELRVWLVDRAGNVGPETTKTLKIMSPRVQHAWMFNAGGAPSLADVERPAGSSLMLSQGDGVWTSGNLADYDGVAGDHALWFPGTGDGAVTDGPAVFPLDSFTVSARVRLDEFTPDDHFYAVSQDGQHNSVFKLGYRHETGTWSAAFHTGDTMGSWVWLSSESGPKDQLPVFPPPGGDGTPDWQHLALIYDAPTRQVRLYVDGNRAAQRAVEDGKEFSWVSAGPLRIGRGQANGSTDGAATGKVDDVVTFDAALNDDQVWQLSQTNFLNELDVTDLREALLADGLAAAWRFDEANGDTASDWSGNGHHLELGEATSWSGGVAGSALHFDGSEEAFAESAGQVVDTALSHTLTAWVRLTGSSTASAGIASQAGATDVGVESSGLQLSYSNSYDAWRFGKRRSDNVELNTVRSFGPPGRDTWVHLAGVFELRDPDVCLPAVRVTQCGEYRLYVDGVLQETREATKPWTAGGTFSLGRYMTQGEFKYPFRGDIDEVRVYQRVLSPAEIRHLEQEG